MELLLKRDGWSLASRLWSMLFLVLAIVVSVFGAVAYSEARDATADAMSQGVGNAARETAGAIGRSVVTRLTLQRHLASGPAVVQAVRRDSPVTRNQSAAISDWFESEQRRGDTVTVARRLVHRDGRVVYAQGTADSATMAALSPVLARIWRGDSSAVSPTAHARIAVRGRRLAVIALLLLVTGTIGIIVLAKRETSPLENVRAAADAMARGETPPKIEPHGASETISLIHSFNGMVDALREGREALEARSRRRWAGRYPSRVAPELGALSRSPCPLLTKR